MRPELETYHLIDRYLRGELYGTELLLFEAEMKSDTSLGEEVEFQKVVNGIVNGAAYDNLRGQMAADIRKIDKRNKVFRNVILGSAIALVVGLAALFYFNQDKGAKITHQPIKLTQTESVIQPKVDLVKKHNQASKKILSKGVSENKKQPTVLRKNNVEALVDNQVDETKESKVKMVPYQVVAANKVIEESSGLPVKPAKVDPCAGIRIMAQPTIQATCAGEATGKILYSESEMQGGNPPYKIGLGKRENIGRKEVFYSLNAGEHVFYIRDARGCEQALSVFVPEKICKVNKFTFYPDQGELWKFPAEVGSNYIITIHDRAGDLLYKRDFIEGAGDEWNGTNKHGTLLESGIYIYLIEYSDGRKENGQVTISR